MKRKYSLNRLLHNNKLMMAVSVILAVVIWVMVVYDSNNIETRTISNVTANLDLANTYAGNDGLVIFEGASQQVDVSVSGPRGVIYKLSASDVLITGDYSAIRDAGTWDVKLVPSRNSSITDYSILSVNPTTVSIFCDYASTAEFRVKADISGLSVDDPDTQLGTPVIEAVGMTDNTLTVHGPKSEVSRIASLVARVDKTETVTDVTTYDARLVALDEDGNEVDTKHCTFAGLTGNTVKVTVPLLVRRTVTFDYTLANVPSALRSREGFCTVTPASIELLGSPTQLDAAIDSIQNLGTFDFHYINLQDTVHIMDLDLPSGVQVVEGSDTVRVAFDFAGLTSKTMDVTLTAANTSVTNVPDDRTTSVSYKKFTNVQLIGSAASLERITEEDLRGVVDLENDEAVGPLVHPVDIVAPGFDDVWVYYGETASSAYDIVITVQYAT